MSGLVRVIYTVCTYFSIHSQLIHLMYWSEYFTFQNHYLPNTVPTLMDWSSIFDESGDEDGSWPEEHLESRITHVTETFSLGSKYTPLTCYIFTGKNFQQQEKVFNSLPKILSKLYPWCRMFGHPLRLLEERYCFGHSCGCSGLCGFILDGIMGRRSRKCIRTNYSLQTTAIFE